jgi:di/tricarboxylate transporter
MNYQLLVVLALLASAIVMFAVNKPRMDAVALIMLTALPFTGAVTMNEALAGFSDGNIVLIAALFVIGDGLVRTGVARRLGDWLTAKAGSNDVLLLVLLMVVVCVLGATMSSTAVTAIFIPVVLRIAQATGTPAGRLMMPLSFAALISGMTTLIATAPNLVVSSELERHGHAGFSFFAFTPFGAVVLALGIAYMSFARHWLAAGDAGKSGSAGRPSLAKWVDEYKLVGREHRVRVNAGSPLAGQTLEQLRLSETVGAYIIALERGRDLIEPDASTDLRAGDVLLVDLFEPGADAAELCKRYDLTPLLLTGAYFTDHTQDIGMAEVIVPATSELAGKTVAEARVHETLGIRVIGIRRGAAAVDGALASETLQVGDTLLVAGPWKRIRRVQAEGKNLVVFNLPAEIDEVLPVPGRWVRAVLVLVLVVALMISGVMPNVQAALLGCLLMGACGCVNLTSAYRAIDWKTIVLIVGMLPFATALGRTGGVQLAAEGLMSAVGAAGPRVVLAALFAITAMLGMFISNTATAVLMAPVAIRIAADTNASPYPFAMIVALAASTAFMTPVSSPVNTLVVTPGNYTFGDFVKVGVPFSLVVLVVCVVMVPWLLPL